LHVTVLKKVGRWSPHKSVRQAGSQLGLLCLGVHNALHIRLKLHAYKLQLV